MRWLPLGIAASLLAAALAPEDAAITQRVTAMITSPKDSLEERLTLWRAAVLFSWDHPFLGGDFRANVRDYVSRATWGSDAPLRIQLGELSTASGEHNGYLAVSAGFGVVVAAFYYAYFIGLGRRIRQAGRTIWDERTRSYLSAGFSALLVWAVGMISSHIILGSDYVLIWGALECAISSARHEEAACRMYWSAWNHSYDRGNYSPRITRCGIVAT